MYAEVLVYPLRRDSDEAVDDFIAAIGAEIVLARP